MFLKNGEIFNILDQLPFRVFWKDLQLRYMGCNRLFLKALDLNSPEEIIGKHTAEYAKSVRMAKIYSDIDDKVLKNNTDLPVSEFVFDQDTNTWTMVVGEIQPLYHTDGARAGVLGNVRPVFNLRDKHAEFNYQNRIIKLNLREMQIWHYLCNGANSREISEILDRSPKTIQSYISNIVTKFGCDAQRKLFHIAQELRFHRIHYNSMMIGFAEANLLSFPSGMLS